MVHHEGRVVECITKHACHLIERVREGVLLREVSLSVSPQVVIVLLIRVERVTLQPPSAGSSS